MKVRQLEKYILLLTKQYLITINRFQQKPEKMQAQQTVQIKQIELKVNKRRNSKHQKEMPEEQTDKKSSNKEEREGIRQPRVKSTLKIIFIGLIISLSAVMLGYSMKGITSIPIETIVRQYDVSIDSFAAQSILIGILPLGSVVGVIISVQLIKKFKRLVGIYIFTLVNVGAVVLINVTTFATLNVGRFIEGICVGFYAYIAPIYLKEIAPKEMRRLLGLFFSLGKIIGVMVAILLELILKSLNVGISYRVILSMTAVFSVLQAILIFFFGSDTPTEMLEKDNREDTLQILRKFYPQKYVDEIFEEYVQEYEADMHREETARSEEDEIARNKKDQHLHQHKQEVKSANSEANPLGINNTMIQLMGNENEGGISLEKLENEKKISKPNLYSNVEEDSSGLTFTQKKFRAYLMGVNMCAIRQFCGGNVLLVQGGLFIKTFNKGLGEYTSLIINTIQFAAILFGIFYIQKILEKRPLFLFSLSVMTILNFAIVVAMIYENILSTMILMCVFMIIFGGSFINANWAIPPQLIPARQLLLANVVHWITLSVANLVPPLVSGAMPNNNPYPVFIFFGLYAFFGFVHVKCELQQTDGRTYMQIVKSWK